MSQKDDIRKHLERKKSITPIDALEKYGVFRLAARVADLRAEGLDIVTETVRKNGKQFARYSLV